MRQGMNNFTGKHCLILGGGDGGLLNELRKENPANIVMVDIDEMVLKAARKHLRGICTDSLDNYKGDNFEVIGQEGELGCRNLLCILLLRGLHSEKLV